VSLQPSPRPVFEPASPPAFGQADLSNCEREQIQLAGSIQPHGALLVVREPEHVVVQARANAALSGMEDRTIRWLVDDAAKFAAREVRRGRRYDGIILDPPKFGRGPKNETWRFEQDLPALLDGVGALLSETPVFVIATAYAVRLSHIALAQALADRLDGLGGRIETGEMALPQRGHARLLPTALYARWQAD